MKSKENKSNMFFCPDGSEVKNNNNNSDEITNFIKVFGDPAHKDSRFSKAYYLEKSSNDYNVLYSSSEEEKKRRKNINTIQIKNISCSFKDLNYIFKRFN